MLKGSQSQYKPPGALLKGSQTHNNRYVLLRKCTSKYVVGKIESI
jgi:hypothetical protein